MNTYGALNFWVWGSRSPRRLGTLKMPRTLSNPSSKHPLPMTIFAKKHASHDGRIPRIMKAQQLDPNSTFEGSLQVYQTSGVRKTADSGLTGLFRLHLNSQKAWYIKTWLKSSHQCGIAAGLEAECP